MSNALYGKLLASVEEEIAHLDIPKTPENLYDPVRYIMSLGGKRIRPVLALLGCQLYGESFKKAMPQAMAIELFHNFTLMHDDVMDSADVRRTVPTVHLKWNHNIALLSGDAMMVMAYQYLFNCHADIAKALGELFSKTAIEVCEGQQLDMDYASSDDVTLEQYLEMIRLKTAVLLSGSLKIGALVAGADAKDFHRLEHFAEALGLAFQVKDDYLDAFGGAEFGKVKGGDIMEGKRTWLTLKSFEIADENTKNELRLALSDSDSNRRVDRVLNIYKTLHIDQLAELEVQKYSSAALEDLDKIQGNKEAKAALIWLVDQLIGRTT